MELLEKLATKIIGDDDLYAHLNIISPKKVTKRRPSFPKQENVINGHTFKNYAFSENFKSMEFRNCKFHDCRFDNISGFFLIFKKCEFVRCEFRNSRFSHGQFGWEQLYFQNCSFRNVEIDEGDITNTQFEKCHMMGLTMAGEDLFDVGFRDCHIENSQFQSIVYYPPNSEYDEDIKDVYFLDCNIQFCYFAMSDFNNSCFYNTTLYLCAFINCSLSDATIIIDDKELSPNYASLDFQTILKSEITDQNILKKYFNIHVPTVKNKIKEISSSITFKTVFISYSFQDQLFATLLNDVLNRNGVKTFLWEKDARGGEYLEDIMTKNVRNHDTILFIASENSLRSKACQFELSEGRKKQEETWNNIFYPIHIDNYLFEVKKNQIRPIESSKEYWNNIEELKRTNSKDFTAFANISQIDLNGFEQAVIANIINNIISEKSVD